jgi:hypothetical protein
LYKEEIRSANAKLFRCDNNKTCTVGINAKKMIVCEINAKEKEVNGQTLLY